MKKYIFDNISMNEIIKNRTSIRTYSDVKIEEDKLEKINNYIKSISGPFNENVRFKFINSNDKINGSKLGTYGVIKGAKYYICVAVQKGEFDLEELGYEMEKVILFATYLGLATCWLGGTFNRGEFAKAMEVQENEIFPIVVPIGYSATKRSVIDATMRFLAKSKNRKEWGELFYLSGFSLPMTQYNNVGKYKDSLENVRLAPSASNKQPWRIVKVDGNYHFYLERTKGYGNKLGFDIQRIDMGIAMCHFELSCIENGLKGSFKKVEPKLKDVPKDTEYIISWIHE